MSEQIPVWIPLLSALIGAVAAGGIQIVLRALDMCRERRSILVAISSEVSAICEMVRIQKYQNLVRDCIAHNEAQTTEFNEPQIYIGSNYFSVFEALAPSLGKIDKHYVRDAVAFYGFCKMAKDSADPNGIRFDGNDRDQAMQNLKSLDHALDRVLQVGDQIAQWPGLKK